MTMRRTAVIAGMLATAALTLSACEKPAPAVTVWSGSSSDRAEARCWSSDATQTVNLSSCVAGGTGVPTLSVLPGQTIGISVDTVVAQDGWYPTIGNQRLTAQPLTTTYYRFALSESDLAQPLQLRVLSLGQGGQQLRGVWLFELTRRS